MQDATPDIFETGRMPIVPMNEWQTLHEVANRVRQKEPWRALTGTDLFGLRDPVTQQVGLVSVLGNLGEVYAVHLYLPPEGLRFWLQFFRKGKASLVFAQFKLRMLEVSFVPKQALTSRDLKLREHLALGTPKSQTNGYPQFRSYRPRCLPWYLEADEVRLLRIALEASLEFVVRRNRSEEPWLIDDSDGEELPVLSVYCPASQQSGAWSVRRERLRVPQGVFQELPAGEVLDELTVHRLPALSVKDQIWQAGASYVPVPLLDEERPVYPVVGLVVNESTDEVFAPALDHDPQIEPAWTVLRAVAAAAIKRDGLPRLIRVGTTESRSALERLREFCPDVIVELSEQLDFLHFVMADLQMGMAEQSLSTPTAGSQKIAAVGSKRFSTKRSKRASGTRGYQLKITLRHSKPPIWRRLVVSGDISLKDLHHVLQVSMGWDNSHLHDFRSGQNRYGDPKLLEGVIDECETSLCQVAPRKGGRFIYTYDFGDN